MSATTTTTTPAASGPATASRTGTSLGRLALVLRLHRMGLSAGATCAALMAGVLLWLRFGPDAAAAAKLQARCATSHGRECLWFQQSELFQFESAVSDMVAVLRDVVPLMAAVAGAALVTRELANGTAELAWTQSVSPVRWLAEKLVLPAVLLAVGTGVLVVLCRDLLDWAGAHRLLMAGYQTNDHFFAVGPSIVAYALLGLTAGFLAAVHFRRAPLALVGGAAATWAAAYVLDPWRTQIWPTVSRAVRGDGPFGFTAWPCEYDQAEHKYSIDACLGAQPASHYWPVQLVETGFVLVLAALVAVVALWRLRRRTG
ncbi:hypothetical protein [Streptomyces winkii]|uniref:hypothetical protein n=1 Tax=Streptomyces winkii TaxID=3051178 RepID=UPI0028D015AB|nr:hypothetical protein [Streptomyces sp. DSM 40971]